MAHVYKCDHLSLIVYKIIEGMGSLPHFKVNLEWKWSVFPEAPFTKEIHDHSERAQIIILFTWYLQVRKCGNKFPQKNVVCFLTPQRDFPQIPETHKGDIFLMTTLLRFNSHSIEFGLFKVYSQSCATITIIILYYFLSPPKKLHTHLTVTPHSSRHLNSWQLPIYFLYVYLLILAFLSDFLSLSIFSRLIHI